MLKKFFITLFIPIIFSGCVVNSVKTGNPAGNKPGVETRVYNIGQPALAKSPSGIAPLLAPLIAPAIDMAVTGLANAAVAAGSDQDYSEQAFTDGFFYTANEANGTNLYVLNQHHKFQYIAVIVARFSGEPGEFNAALGSSLIRNLKSKGVKETPHLYYEGFIEIKTDQKLFRIKSAALYYGKHLLDKMGDKNRDLLLQFDFKNPAEGKIFATATINIQNIAPGTTLVDRELKRSVSSWMSILSITDLFGKTELDRINLLKPEQTALITKICSDVDPTDNMQKELAGNIMKTGLGLPIESKPEEVFEDKCKNKVSWPTLSLVNETDYNMAVAVLEKCKEDLKNAKESALESDAVEFLKLKVGQQQKIVDTMREKAFYVEAFKDLNQKITIAKKNIKDIGLFETHLTLTETKDGNRFFAKLGEVLTTTNPAYSQLLKDKFDPASKEKVLETQKVNLSKRQELEAEYRKTLNDIKVSQVKLAAGDLNFVNRIEEEFKFEEAKISAVILADQLGIKRPIFD